MRVQSSSSGLRTMRRAVSATAVSPAKMLNVPVKCLWIVATAVVGRPSESGSPYTVSTTRSVESIVRHQRIGRMIDMPPAPRAMGIWAPVVYSDSLT